jgi:hypothetical protein
LAGRANDHISDLRRWREAAAVVLERVRVGDRPALEVIELAAEARAAVPGGES